ncbi:hypothetical protein C4J81_12190 [Deltaproteobacteria bacterium Smac51]|nr:hypothetical protein C4J81_12190 [Deltaproteobacteria bacterium Smac51]
MQELKILASSRLIPPAVVQRFEAKHGIRIRFEYFESAEALASYLESRPSEDLALVRGHYIDDLKDKGQLAKLDHNLLPNLKNMDPTYIDSLPDPGCHYSVPYLVGNIGLIYRNDVLGRTQPNLNQLFEPNTVTVPFSIMNQYRDAIGIALKYLGYSYNSTTIPQIEDAVDLLKSLGDRPSFIGFLSNDATLRFLKEGITYVAMSYNNEAAKVIEEDPRMAFSTVEGGRVAWSYAHIISYKSEHLPEVHVWLNYLMEPEVAAEVSVWNLATSPNLAAREFLPESVKNNPVLYPEGGVWEGAEIPGSVGDAGKTYVEYWHRL